MLEAFYHKLIEFSSKRMFARAIQGASFQNCVVPFHMLTPLHWFSPSSFHNSASNQSQALIILIYLLL